jgi:hypothetical protein
MKYQLETIIIIFKVNFCHFKIQPRQLQQKNVFNPNDNEDQKNSLSPHHFRFLPLPSSEKKMEQQEHLRRVNSSSCPHPHPVVFTLISFNFYSTHKSEQRRRLFALKIKKS